MVIHDPAVAAAVWEHSSAGVFAVDRNGRLALMNVAAEQILGVGARAQAGAHFEETLAGHPALVRLLREALAGRPALSRAEIGLGPAEDVRTLGFSLTTWPAEDGDLGGVALVFRDLTPIERSDERQRQQERLAALGAMAAGLAHELRNPLAGMEVAAGLLERRFKHDAESLELVGDLRLQLRSLSDTVTASLDFLRPVQVRRECLDPVECLEDALSVALSRAPAPDRVERRFAAALPAFSGDRALLGVALTNLLINACEALLSQSGSASRLELGLEVGAAPELTRAVRVDQPGTRERAPARELRIAVADNGPGIPTDQRDKIFDPFFTTKERGSGIGLAHVQKIVAAHGGSLSLTTSAAGSTFLVHLPLLEEGA